MDFDSKFDRKKIHTDLDESLIKSILTRTGFKASRAIQHLTGGYSSQNFKFQSQGRDLVLRISHKSEREFYGEISVLKKLQATIPVPEVLFEEVNCPELSAHISVQSFMKGELLSLVEDRLDPSELRQIGSSLGSHLARIHQFEFENSGFFGLDGIVSESFPSFSEQAHKYLQQFLATPLLQQRLEPLIFDQLKKYIFNYKGLIDSLDQTRRLVHSDFNQKNILVCQKGSNWEVSAVLDWEFSFSGCPLVDFGNFFRFDEELPGDYETSLLQAYRAGGGELSSNWREQARYLDLTSMLELLTRAQHSPKTFATAQAVIERTLSGDYLGG